MRAFDGKTYDESLDKQRLVRQIEAVKRVMADGAWRTLGELALKVNAPEASVSARLRDLRKARHGSRTVERRRRGAPKRGLFEYRVTP